jgi:lipid-binding SYLF domain-containing protein
VKQGVDAIGVSGVWAFRECCDVLDQRFQQGRHAYHHTGHGWFVMAVSFWSGAVSCRFRPGFSHHFFSKGFIMHIRHCLSIVIATLLCVGFGCSSGSSAPSTEGQQLDSANAAAAAIEGFRGDPRASRFFESAFAYAVFPKIIKGALGLGVSDGNGEVYRNGRLVGYAQATSVTVGVQIGGQTFSEIIFFENRFVFNKFTNDQLTGQASTAAVAGKSGDSAMADYSHGVAIFTSNDDGLILAADIGGQKFRYTAK